MDHYKAQLDTAIQAALEGGRFLRRSFHFGASGDGAEAERQIRCVLLQRFSEYGYLGEEAGIEPGWDPGGLLWLVDPLDGANAFEEGHRGPCVSIALLRNGAPALGVVYAFSWPDEEGDLFAWAEGMPPLLRNAGPVVFDPGGVPDTLAVSQGAERKSRVNAELARPWRCRATASIACRQALVAAGEAVAGNSLNRPCGWDYAAGHALLCGAGLELVDENGEPVQYSATEGSSCGAHCTAGAGSVARDIAARDWVRIWREGRGPVETYDLRQPDRARPVADTSLPRRGQGCLLGQLAGGALGSLVESESPRSIAARYPQGVRRMADGGAHNTIAGQPTDDSELALMLARAVLKAGRFDSEAVARAHCWWYDSRPFDIGAAMGAALAVGAAAAQQNAASAAGACRRAANHDSEANGALMRVAPLGILGAGSGPGQAARWAGQDALLTHPNPVCRDASPVFAASLAFAIGAGADGRATHHFALITARRMGAHPKVVEAIERAATGQPPDFMTHQGHVIIALQNAFYQALHAPSLEEGVADTIGRGGDTDNNAAVAGALLGAIHGRAAIPFAWLDRILTCRPLEGLPGVRRARPKAMWPVDALILAEQLLWLGRCLR